MQKILLLLLLTCSLSFGATRLPPAPPGLHTKEAKPTKPKATPPAKSPKDSANPTAKRMVRSDGDNKIVLAIHWEPYSDTYGEGQITLFVDAFQPPNTGLLFEYTTVATGPWDFLGYWEPYPEAQWVGVGWHTWIQPPKFVRVKALSISRLTPSQRVMGAGAYKLPRSKTKPLR